jgi:hypothetical protein
MIKRLSCDRDFSLGNTLTADSVAALGQATVAPSPHTGTKQQQVCEDADLLQLFRGFRGTCKGKITIHFLVIN